MTAFADAPALEAVVLDTLRGVDDPELGISIVDLGLVASVSVADGEVVVVLMMTTPTCPLGDLMAETATAAVTTRLGSGYAVRVTVDRDAPWAPDLASPEVRRRFERPPSRVGAALRSGLARLRGTP